MLLAWMMIITIMLTVLVASMITHERHT